MQNLIEIQVPDFEGMMLELAVTCNEINIAVENFAPKMEITQEFLLSRLELVECSLLLNEYI